MQPQGWRVNEKASSANGSVGVGQEGHEADVAVVDATSALAGELPSFDRRGGEGYWTARGSWFGCCLERRRRTRLW